MIEIIVAILLQITTILNGGDAEKVKAEQDAKSEKQKTQQDPSLNSTPAAEGGQGGWTG